MEKDNSPKVKWIKELINSNLAPIINLIREIMPEEDPVKVESEEIKKHIGLLNANEGGNKPPCMAGWNKKELPVEAIEKLGKISDRMLASEYGIEKTKIMRERKKRGITSYASTTGQNGKFDGKGVHPRWKT